jgi:hypothetical protein
MVEYRGGVEITWDILFSYHEDTRSIPRTPLKWTNEEEK